MTPGSTSDDTDSIRVPVSVAVAIGRIEEKLSSMGEREGRNDERLTRVEGSLAALNNTVTEMRAQQRPKAPWYVVVGGIAGIGTIALAAWTMFQLAAQLAAVQ